MTHKMIKSKFIRRMYAQELAVIRVTTSYKYRSSEFFKGMLMGLESAFWKMETVMR